MGVQIGQEDCLRCKFVCLSRTLCSFLHSQRTGFSRFPAESSIVSTKSELAANQGCRFGSHNKVMVSSYKSARLRDGERDRQGECEGVRKREREREREKEEKEREKSKHQQKR